MASVSTCLFKSIVILAELFDRLITIHFVSYDTWTMNKHIDFNTLWPSEAIWRQRSGSTLSQITAWCRQVIRDFERFCGIHLKAISQGCSSLFVFMKQTFSLGNGPYQEEVVWGQFHKRYPSRQSLNLAWKLLIWFSYDYSKVKELITTLPNPLGCKIVILIWQ